MKKFFFSILLMTTLTASQAQNPFLQEYKTPHGTPPFDKVKLEHYKPAFIAGMEQHKKEVNAITNQRSLPTFVNTIEALANSGKTLNKVSSVFFNLLSAESNDQMMVLSQELSPLLSAHSNSITLNEALFQRVKAVYNDRMNQNLTPEQIRLVEKTYREFEDSGASLSAEDKKKFEELSTKHSQFTLNFGQNVLKETNKFEMLLTTEEELAGLPQMVRDAAAAKAKAKGKEGYLIDLSAPSMIPFMKYSTRRDLRQKLYLANATKCVAGGEFDNQKNITEIVNTRLAMANLLGYSDYATYSLRDKMAKDKDGVYGLLNELHKAYANAAFADAAEVKGFAVGSEQKAIDFQPWDWGYYSEKLKDAKYQVNEQMTRPYFELENVKKGVFGLATDLFGITFKKNPKIPVYHPEVEAFEVFDKDGKYLSVLFTDFHPRDGKRQGAWMTEYKGQWIEKGVNSRPHVSLVMNFTRPTATEPALLSFDEVETFLHEFGHGLHGIFANSNYESLSGTNVPRDFVELPSQLLENWLTQKEFLDRFAVHYKTGEKIPADLVQKLIDASNYLAGYMCYRQLSFGFLDMEWHTQQKPFSGDVRQFEQKAMAATTIIPVVKDASMSTSFNHIFAGGYAAGYYSYKWSEVLEADAFALFKKNGIFNKATAESYRKNILEPGNSADVMDLYVKFRGQKPTVDALLERNGVLKNK